MLLNNFLTASLPGLIDAAEQIKGQVKDITGLSLKEQREKERKRILDVASLDHEVKDRMEQTIANPNRTIQDNLNRVPKDPVDPNALFTLKDDLFEALKKKATNDIKQEKREENYLNKVKKGAEGELKWLGNKAVDAAYGFEQGARKFSNTVANVGEAVKNYVPIPGFESIGKYVEDFARGASKQPGPFTGIQPDARPADDFSGKLAQMVGGVVPGISEAVMFGPTLPGFAASGFMSEIDKGVKPAAMRALENTLLGTAFKATAPFDKATRVGTSAGILSAPGLLLGDPEQAALGALMGGTLGAMGPKQGMTIPELYGGILGQQQSLKNVMTYPKQARDVRMREAKGYDPIEYSYKAGLPKYNYEAGLPSAQRGAVKLEPLPETPKHRQPYYAEPKVSPEQAYRLGKISRAETMKLAEQITEKDVAKLFTSKHEEMGKIGQIIDAQHKDIGKTAARVLNGDKQAIFDFAKQFESFGKNAVEALVKSKSAARALDIHQQFQHKFKDFYELANSKEGQATIMELAKKWHALENPGQVVQFVKKMASGSPIMEAWINGLLSSPVSHAANIVGNTGAQVVNSMENYLTSGVGYVRKGINAARGKKSKENMTFTEAAVRSKALVDGTIDAFRVGMKYITQGASDWKASPFAPDLGGTKGRITAKVERQIALDQAKVDAGTATKAEMARLKRNQSILPGVKGIAPMDSKIDSYQYKAIKSDPKELQRLQELVQQGEKAVKAGTASKQEIMDYNKNRRALKLRQVLHKPINITGAVVRTPGNALNMMDNFFKIIAYRTEVNGLAIREAKKLGLKGKAFDAKVAEIRSNPEKILDAEGKPRIHLDAVDVSKYLTFTRDLGTIGKWVQTGTNLAWPAKLLVPFVRTPANLLKYPIERTPGIGFLTSQGRAGLKEGGVKLDQAIAKQMMGGLLGYTAFTLAKQGWITGAGPKDPNEFQQKMRTGWRPFSMKSPITGQYHSYEKLEPVSTIFGIMGSAAELQDRALEGRHGDKLASMALAAINRSFLGKTWMKGVSDAFNAFFGDDENRFSQWGQNIIKTAVPRIVAKIAETQDPVLRETWSHLGAMQTIKNTLSSQIPGMRQDLPAKLDRVTGKPVKNLSYGWTSMFNPIRKGPNPDVEGRDPVMSELEKLEIHPQKMRRAVDQLKISPSERNQIIQKIGDNPYHGYKRIKEMLSEDWYKEMKNSEKRKWVLRELEMATTQAMEEFKRENKSRIDEIKRKEEERLNRKR